jgi:nickel/cobalt transporter (NicO) family protein
MNEMLTWWYLPSALLLGALHGLEPGHSKTMIAAYIVAIRGTWRQAVVLGISATASHTAVIWVLVALALHYKDKITAESAEPYLLTASGILVILMAVWTGWRTWRAEHPRHDHDHHHHDNPHHGHGSEDAHAAAHARQMKKQVIGQEVTWRQIVLFGLTGGLLPCPAAFSVLLLCLNSGAVSLGFALVLAFSVGLALTMIAVGAVAAWGTGHATQRFSFLNVWAGRAPYFSSLVLGMLGGYMLWQGLIHLF